MKSFITLFAIFFTLNVIFFACSEDSVTESVEVQPTLSVDKIAFNQVDPKTFYFPWTDEMVSDIQGGVQQIMEDNPKTFKKFNKNLTLDKNSLKIGFISKLTGKSFLGDSIHMSETKAAVNMGNNFQYHKGDPMIFVYLSFNHGSNNIDQFFSAETNYFQTGVVGYLTKENLDLLSPAFGLEDGYWEVEDLSPNSYRLLIVVYVAPGVPIITTLFSKTMYNYSWQIESDRSDNNARSVVSIQP